MIEITVCGHLCVLISKETIRSLCSLLVFVLCNKSTKSQMSFFVCNIHFVVVKFDFEYEEKNICRLESVSLEKKN